MPVGEYRNQDVIAPAREGTRRVLEAAQRAGVARVVITSSTAAAMPGPSGPTTLDETVWTDLPAKPKFDYQRAKTFAESACSADRCAQAGTQPSLPLTA